MGIKYAHELTHSISGLSLGNIETITRNRYLFSQYYNNPQMRLQQPTMDVDISWLYRKNSHITEDNRILYVINICLEFARLGIAVILICDGNQRHHSKRASIERRRTMYDNTINSIIQRSDLMRINQERLRATTVPECERLLLLETALSKKIKSLEKKDQAAKVEVGQTFYEALCAHVDGIPLKDFDNKNGKIYVIQSEFQADPVIAHRLVNGISDISLCNDSDLANLAGSDCISIHQYKMFNRKLSDFGIFTASTKTLDKVKEWLRINDTTPNITIRISSFPVFDGVECVRCRALIAVALGCDVFTTGIKFLRKTELYDVIQSALYSENNQQKFDKIMEFIFQIYWRPRKETVITLTYINMMNEFRIKFINTMNVYVDTLLFEPCNFISKNLETTNESKNLYINNNYPDYLHRYIQEFARTDTNINIYGVDSDLALCAGPGNGTHVFLAFEEQVNCYSCNHACCSSCVFGTSKNLCVNCYMEELTIPSAKIDENVSVEAMRHRLIDYGLDISMDISLVELIDIYDAIVNQKQVIYDVDIMNMMTIPFETSEYLSQIRTLMNFDVRNGGSFINNQCLVFQNQVDILHLLSLMVDLYTTDEVENLKYNDTKLYQVIPKLYINFANKARLHGGYRLLKRAARHATDPLSPGILESSGEFFQYEDTIAMTIRHVIKASMKKQDYNVVVCFNKDGIICCQCDCKAGSSEKERVICVHVIPVLLQFTILLWDGLSEHILYELSNSWNNKLQPADISDVQADMLFDSLQKIYCASGKTIQNADKCCKKLKIINIVKEFSVQTERSRDGPGPPNVNNLGPLLTLIKTNPTTKIEKIIKRTTRSSEKLKSPPVKMTETPDIIDYDSCMWSVQIIRSWFECADDAFNECVGYKVLRYRSKQLPQNHEQYKTKLLNLLEDAKSSIRHTRQFSKVSGEIIVEDELDSLRSQQEVNEEMSISSSDSMDDEDDKKPSAKKPTKKDIVEDDTNSISDISVMDTDNEHSNEPTKKQRRKCCCYGCEVSTGTHQNAIWTTVPKVPTKPNTATTKDNALKIYHKKIFARKEWLRRVGIPISDDRKFLFICDQHPIEYEKIQYAWCNKSKVNEMACDYIKLPKDPYVTNLLTRNQSSIRKSAKRRIQKRKTPVKKKNYKTKT